MKATRLWLKLRLLRMPLLFRLSHNSQSEVLEHLARRLPEEGGAYIQAESEVSAINMVFGAACAGARVMTASSSPGISLMQEGISYIASAQLPAVLVNIMRGSPGLGGIHPSQADYFQSVKGGGHGDYKLVVLAPSSVQELIDHTVLAFEIAEKYRTPVMVFGDAMMGQMMEPVFLPEAEPAPIDRSWATTGMKNREKPNIIHTLYLPADDLENHCQRLLPSTGKYSVRSSSIPLTLQMMPIFW